MVLTIRHGIVIHNQLNYEFNALKIKMITVIDQQDSLLILEIRDLDVFQVATLRRIILTQISAYSVGEVEIIHNTSKLIDEVLVHRLVTMPLMRVDIDAHEDIVNGFHPQTDIIIDLEALDNKIYIKARDIQCPLGFSFSHPDILLVTLLQGQRIQLKAKIAEGTGADHSSFSPVTNAWFQKDDKNKCYRFYMTLTGTMDGGEILQQAINKLA